jgi:hypothetical protein
MAFELRRISNGLVRVEGAHGLAVNLRVAGATEPIMDQWSLRVREKSTSRQPNARLRTTPPAGRQLTSASAHPRPGAQAGSAPPPSGSSSQAQGDDPWM